MDICFCGAVVQSPHTRLRARTRGYLLLWRRSTIGFSLSWPNFFLLVDSPAPGLRNVPFTICISPAVMRHFSGESCSQMRFDDLFFFGAHTTRCHEIRALNIRFCIVRLLLRTPPRSVLVTRFVLARSTIRFSLSWRFFFCCLTLLLQSSAMSTVRMRIS